PPIMVEHLLTNTSGLDELIGHFDLQKEVAPDEMYAAIRQALLREPPGTSLYSGWFSGQVLLHRLIEAVSGVGFEEFLHMAILRPLGMQHTGMLRPDSIVPQRASGYEIAPDFNYRRSGYVNPAHPYAGGAMYSTAEDLALWVTALQKGTLVSRLALRQ